MADNERKKKKKRSKQTSSSSGSSAVLRQLDLRLQPEPAPEAAAPAPAKEAPAKVQAPTEPDSSPVEDFVFKIFGATVDKTSEAGNSPVNNTGKIIQFINFMMANYDKDETTKFTESKKLITSTGFEFLRSSVFEHVRKADGAAGEYLKSRIILNGESEAEKDKQHWQKFEEIIVEALSDNLAREAYRFGGASAEADISFGRLANEICTKTFLIAEENPSDKLKILLEPLRREITVGASAAVIFAGVGVQAGRDVDRSGAGEHAGTSMGNGFGLGAWKAKSRLPLIAVAAAIGALALGAIYYFKHDKPAAKNKPAATSPAILPEAPKNEGLEPAEIKVPKAIPVNPGDIMKLPEPEVKPAEIIPAPPATQKKPAIKMREPDQNTWNFKRETSKGTPEYMAMRIKQAIINKLLPENAEYADVLTAMINEFGGNKNQLQMNCFKEKINFTGEDGQKTSKDHTQLDAADKMRLSLALFSKLYNLLPKEGLDSASAEILSSLPDAMKDGLTDLLKSYAQIAQNGHDLDAYREYRLKKPAQNSTAENAENMAVEQKGSVLKLEDVLIRIQTVDIGDINPRIWGAFVRDGLKIAA